MRRAWKATAGPAGGHFRYRLTGRPVIPAGRVDGMEARRDAAGPMARHRGFTAGSVPGVRPAGRKGTSQMSRDLRRIGWAWPARRPVVVVIWLVLLVAAGLGVKIGWSRLDNAYTLSGSPSQRYVWIIPCSVNPQSPVTCRTCITPVTSEPGGCWRGAGLSPCRPGPITEPLLYTPRGFLRWN